MFAPESTGIEAVGPKFQLYSVPVVDVANVTGHPATIFVGEYVIDCARKHVVPTSANKQNENNL